MTRLALGLWLLALAGCERNDITATRQGDLVLSVDGGLASHELAYDFGVVALGGSSVVRVDATNVGKDALTVTRLTLEGSDTGAFFVKGELGLVQPGATTSATVTFAPARVASQATRLVFEHDANAPRPVADLSGTGQ